MLAAPLIIRPVAVGGGAYRYAWPQMTEIPERGQADRFQELLNSRGVQFLGCPACGAGENTWGGFANTALNVTTAPGSDAPSGALHAMLAVCGQCGFIAMFDVGVIGQ